MPVGSTAAAAAVDEGAIRWIYRCGGKPLTSGPERKATNAGQPEITIYQTSVVSKKPGGCGELLGRLRGPLFDIFGSESINGRNYR